ncbi:MAG: flagellar protein FlaG [Cellulosilyticum sp.]|nr:flagellar protein FlaG [Cellulosilyticum sp.]
MQISGINNDMELSSKIRQYQKTENEAGLVQGKDNTVEKEPVKEPLKEQQVEESLTSEDLSFDKEIFYRENEFKFSIHEETKQVMIKVINRKTQEIIKEIPEEKILDMVAKMCENAGIYIDERK